MTCFFTRFFFIGSGLDLKVFHICFLMLSLLQALFGRLCFYAHLNGYKERAFGRQPIMFYFSNFSFVESWKLLLL
jgi:hypothetical protein